MERTYHDERQQQIHTIQYNDYDLTTRQQIESLYGKCGVKTQTCFVITVTKILFLNCYAEFQLYEKGGGGKLSVSLTVGSEVIMSGVN